MSTYDPAERPVDRHATRIRPIAYQDPFQRALTGAVVLLGWLFVGWALLSAARA